MKKIYNAVASEYEMPQLTPQSRYLKCEALTGEWWYKDMQTGEDLPMFTTPIDWVHHDSKTFDEEKFMEDVERNYIEKHTTHIKCYTEEYVCKLNKEIDRLNNIINELEKYLKEDFDIYCCNKTSQKTIKSAEIIVKAMILDKLKELKEGNNDKN